MAPGVNRTSEVGWYNCDDMNLILDALPQNSFHILILKTSRHAGKGEKRGEGSNRVEGRRNARKGRKKSGGGV